MIDSMDLGGAQTVLLNLARAWPREIFPLEVAAMHGRGVFARAFEEEGIPFHSLSSHKYLPFYLWRLPHFLASGRFAVVHCHLFGSNWIAKPISAAFRIPLIVSHDHCNDLLRHEKWAALCIDRATNRLSDSVIAVSASTRQFLLTHEQLPEEKVHLVHNGVDTGEFRPASAGQRSAARREFGLPEDAFVVGGVGRMVPQKNFARWLRTFAAARSTNPSLRGILAGSGPQLEELRALARSLNLGDSVKFSGFVENRTGLLHAMDCLLVTSDFEGLPMNVLEAMAAGVPVIGSRVDGLAEILEHGQDALLAGIDQESEFVDALNGLIASPQRRTKLSHNALLKIETRFSARAMVDKILHLYRNAGIFPDAAAVPLADL